MITNLVKSVAFELRKQFAPGEIQKILKNYWGSILHNNIWEADFFIQFFSNLIFVYGIKQKS